MSFFISTFKALSSFLLGVLIVFLGFEGVLRVLPSIDMPQADFNNAITRFYANKEFTYSMGWQMFKPIRGRVNNYGFPSEHDYQEGQEAVLVIGDSHVEAIMISQQKRMQDILGAKLPYPVFTMGFSGYSLADYIKIAEYGFEKFKPRALVFLILPTDLPESFVSRGRGLHFIPDIKTGEIKKSPMIKSAGRILLDKATVISATVRYLRFNLKLQHKIKEIWQKDGERGDSEKAKASENKTQVDSDKKIIVQALFKRLALLTQEKNVPVYILLDGNRRLIYKGENKNIEEFADIKQYAALMGFKVIDLQSPFWDYYHATGRRLDFSPFDLHWNHDGHRIAAEEILKNWS